VAGGANGRKRLQAGNEQTPQVDRLMSKPPRLQELRKALAELTSDRGRQ